MRIGVAFQVLLVIALPTFGCASGPKSTATTLPYLPKLDSPGVSLLAFVPPAADAVLEVDLKRLRENPVVGPLFASMLGIGKSTGAISGGLVELIGDADLLVAAAYGVGGYDATALVVLRGEKFRGARLATSNATALDDTTIVIGSDVLRKKVQAMVAADDDGMFADRAFLKTRDAAVPEGARGAVMRLAARLTPQTRVAAAGRLHLDQVPAVASVWFDIVDDAALVAHLVVDDAESARETVRMVRKAYTVFLQKWLPRGALSAEAGKRAVRVVWVVGPKRLAAWVAVMRARSAIAPGPEPKPGDGNE